MAVSYGCLSILFTKNAASLSENLLNHKGTETQRFTKDFLCRLCLFACPSGQLPCIHKYCFTQRAQRSKARKEKYVATQFRRERCEKSLIKRLNKDMCTG